jgi:hypothetical protein
MNAATLKTGLLTAIVFPLLLACGVGLLTARTGKENM